jgi:hypothetical protein
MALNLALQGIAYLYTLKRMVRKSIWFFVLLFLGACLDQPDCFELSNNYVGISFKKLYDGKADTLSIIGITAPSTDSVFYPFVRATSLRLEVNPFEPSTDFTIETLVGSYKFFLGYKSSIKFVSEDCGTSTQLSGLNINLSEFDSVRIINPLLTNPAQVNIEVLRCPRTNFMKLSFRKLVNGVESADSVQITNVLVDYPVVYTFPGGKTTTINVPLNVNSSATTVVFTFADGTSRTITVQGNRIPWNEYQLCSGLTLFNQLNTTASTFSQVISIRDSIQDPPITNFEVYR